MSAKISEEFWEHYDKLALELLVPSFLEGEIRPCTNKDFESYRKSLNNKLICLVNLFKSIEREKQELSDKLKKKLLKVIIIVGEHNCKNPWNTFEDVKICKALIDDICKIYKCVSLNELFKNDDIFQSVILLLRPKLLKNTWQKYPSAVTCFRWLISLIEKPLLKLHLSSVLPTILIILDSHIEGNKIIGLECLKIILDHCYKSKALRESNYHEVVYETLKKMTYGVETNIVLLLYSCLADILDIIEYIEENQQTYGWTKRDEIFSVLIDRVEMQMDRDKRYVNIVSLSYILNKVGLGKWSARLGSVLSEYCENKTDLKTLKIAYEILIKFLTMYQPKNIKFYSAIYLSVLKLQCDIMESSEIDDEQIVQIVKEAFSLLRSSCPTLHNEILKDETVKQLIETIETKN